MTSSDYGKFEGKWVREAPVEEMRAAFVGWEPEVERYLEASGDGIFGSRATLTVHVVR